MEKQDKKKLTKTIIARLMLWPIAIGVLVLLPAGTFDYWEAYVYAGIMLVSSIGMMLYFLKTDPELLVRRMKTKEKEKPQKIFQIVAFPIFILAYVLPALDKRFGWSEVPFWVIILSDVLIALGYVLVFAVFKQNSYAARTVEVEEGQELISDGLYGWVRHPMYIAALLLFLPVSTALGSWWGLVPMILFPAVLVLRILNEEKVLKEGLDGYNEYCQKVKYRLVPGIW